MAQSHRRRTLWLKAEQFWVQGPGLSIVSFDLIEPIEKATTKFRLH